MNRRSSRGERDILLQWPCSRTNLALWLLRSAVFNGHGIAYALIGGLAVGLRSGVPRATLDVDFAIPTAVDRSRVTGLFVQHGFRLTGEFAHTINFEHESGEPVQLAFDEAFDVMIARAENLASEELELRVVTKS